MLLCLNLFVIPVSNSSAEVESKIWSQLDSYVLHGSDVLLQLQQNWLHLRPGMTIGCPIAPSTRAGLMLLAPSSDAPVKTIFIYVDGGYLPHLDDGVLAQSTWGLCVITEHLDGAQVLQGCLGGWVSNHVGDGVSVGIKEHNSFAAEIQAHLFARLLLVQSNFFGGGEGCPNWVRQHVGG